ncbi:MAG: hypothetical protein GXO22_06165 [Aquificae bacterium]|nr:hypothetical protein [Aquificota bacterium]
MGSYFEELYQLYKETIKNEEEEMIELAEKFGLTYNKNYENKKQPKFGDIFFFYHKGIPIYYLFLEKEGDFYKVLKVSDFWRLANQNDMLTKVDGEKWAVETWNSFYIDTNQYKNSVYIGSLPDDDTQILKDFLSRKIKTLPPDKRGLTVPEGDYNFYQNKFHRDEALLVKDLSLRVFDLIEEADNIIYLAPTKLEKQPLSAGKENTVYTADRFVLFLDKNHKIINLEPSKDLVGKPAILKIFDEEYETPSLPDEILLKLPDNIDQINLNYIGKNIKIEVED